MAATYLDRILDHHREIAADDNRSVASLNEQARAMGPTRGFRAALRDRGRLGVIAEIKRRSPSKGDLNTDLVAADLASKY